MIVDAIMAFVLAPCCAAAVSRSIADARRVCPSLLVAIRRSPAALRDLRRRLADVAREHDNDQRCDRCRRLPRQSPWAAPWPYDGRLRDILHALKYDGRRSVARHWRTDGRRGAAVLAGADFVVPVPCTSSDDYRRGFNQAEELAKGDRCRVVRALRRRRAPPRRPICQKRSAITTCETHSPCGARGRAVKTPVVLVDDVSTTGATLDACARVLLEAGAKEVRALTAARAVSRLR